MFTPLCLLVTALETHKPKLPVDAPEKPNGFRSYSNVDTNLPIKGIAGALIIAFVSAALLFPLPPTTLDAGTGVGFLLSLMFVYFIIHQRRLESPVVEDNLPLISIPALSTAWRVLAILSLIVLVPSQQRADIHVPLVVITAFAKMVQWVATLELINRGFLLPLSTIATFVNSFLQITALPITGGKVELVAGVALVSLAQTYRSIHKFPYSRPVLATTALVLFVTMILRRSDQVHYKWHDTLNSFGEQLHPIEILVKEANEDFAALVKGQSKTIDQATAEYKRRYQRTPPPGFEQWVQLSLEADCPIIDNFDTIMHTFDPFWGISAQEFRARASMTEKPPLAQVIISNHTLTMPKDSLVLGHFNEIVTEWTNRYIEMLPDMEFIINGLAEPRVIVANDRLDHLIHTCAPIPEGEINGTRKELEVMDLGKESSWQIGTRSCPEDSPSRSILIPEDQPGLRFVKNATHAKDWCQHPEAAVSHGLFSSPYNLKITDTLVPVFSHGKPSTSQDILYPSPDYLVGYREGNYNETMDTPWDEKTNQLYWSGSDTGGYAVGKNWKNFHRQRFVEMVTKKEQEIELLARSESGTWDTTTQQLGNLTDLVNVKFSTIEACSGYTCREEEKELPVGGRDDASVAYQYRFLFDVDGMGRTERYYRLLGSRATILKQTMHQEWHDDRLIPWVHYVPVSLEMDELPEILRFLITTESGQKISENIAEQGREWQQKALREKDMDLAFLRILMEYGRLLSPTRDEDGYCPDGRMRPD